MSACETKEQLGGYNMDVYLDEYNKRCIKFLKQNKALLPFIVALKEQKGVSLCECLKKHPCAPPWALINISFAWCKTKEGEEFWARLYRKSLDEERVLLYGCK